MRSTTPGPGGSAPPAAEPSLASTYRLVILVEALVIAALYIVGRYFG